MFIDLTPEQHALRRRVRDYFQQLMTPELRHRLRRSEGGSEFRRVVRQMGRDGWLASLETMLSKSMAATHRSVSAAGFQPRSATYESVSKRCDDELAAGDGQRPLDRHDRDRP